MFLEENSNVLTRIIVLGRSRSSIPRLWFVANVVFAFQTKLSTARSASDLRQILRYLQ